MNKSFVDRVLANLTLTPKQEKAALARGRDVAVTAGAGSGKTSTLVARYATLLAEGCDVRKIVAITFTEKAAREMRSRTREILEKLARQAISDEERRFWLNIITQMDAARISTIHSLCAEILRAHPVEARIDPKFEVLDEGLASALRVQVVKDTMARLVSIPEFAPLFRVMGTDDLSSLLTFLIENRLEAQEAFNQETPGGEQIVRQAIENALNDLSISECVSELRGMGETAINNDAGDKLALRVLDLLRLWREAEASLAADDIVNCAGYLYRARRDCLGGRGGSRTSRVKSIVDDLKEAYDNLLDPICGGKDTKGESPNRETEANFLLASGLIKPAFEMMISSYRDALVQRGAVDFDDLENGAVQLLSRLEIREKWQGEIEALLVDEFQDTNERQRKIVRALAGTQGRLFVVGDAKQSIYRFRRADVTVFRSLREEIMAHGGLPIDLDETFRTHKSLLDVMSDLLRDSMGIEEDPSRPFYEPFSPMVAIREQPRDGILSPHVEFVLGAGQNADKARPVAAQALATRLLELKEQGQIEKWDDVTLLFRASTGFPHYEDAFEDANIPFVTVAGRGFYDRSEIRDVLNLLRALADLTDDLAMAGLLRSPAFGLTDAAICQLRRQSTPLTHFFDALQGDLSILEHEEQLRAERALSILNDLIPRVDRIPVVELIKQLIDATDYRAILVSGEKSGTDGRMWRNLDKLVADAQDSGKVTVRDFLEYITTINDVGAREGEAPADAQGSVRLMTVHKSKGLQFPIVVIADASRRANKKGESAYLLSGLGLAFKMDPPPMLYRLAKYWDQRQNDAEEQRVLYVALTRAQEKLVISGHAIPTKKSGWTIDAWLRDLSASAQVDVNLLMNQAGREIISRTVTGHPVRAWAGAIEKHLPENDEPLQSKSVINSHDLPLYAPLAKPNASIVVEDTVDETRARRTTGTSANIPPGVVGNMVHKAIELWLFPGNPRLHQLLDATALDAGLAQQDQRAAAASHANELLQRLYNSPLRKEIEATTERYHEVPYSRMVGDHAEIGYIDLLYRTIAGWQIVDFKTDSIRSDAHRADLMIAYSKQMQRYKSVITNLLGQEARTRICFLDDHGKVELAAV